MLVVFICDVLCVIMCDWFISRCVYRRWKKRNKPFNSCLKRLMILNIKPKSQNKW